MRRLRWADGTQTPVLGQGTWKLGEPGADRRAEVDALRLGLDLGLALIDAAEMYADGGAEEVVAEAIAGRRDEVFLVSKVYPHNAGGTRMARAVEASLRRLRVDHLDLLLLHWRGSIPLADTVEGFRRLRERGLIRRWGVSNLDLDDLAELGEAAAECATDQVLLNLEHRGPEFDLLPWCEARGMPVMAYSPVGQGGALLRHPALRAVAARHGCPAARVALAWCIRRPGVLAIPKASSPEHLRDNAAAAELVLAAEDLAALDAAFPPPGRKRPLAML